MKEIPISAKVALTCLLGVVLGIFLFSSVVHAETIGWSDKTYVGGVLYLGNNTFKIQCENIGAFTNGSTTLSNVEVWMYKTNAPTGTVYGVLSNDFSTTTGAYTAFATSSNSYASTSFTTSAQKFDFAFSNVEVGEMTWFLLVSSASSSAVNIRYNINIYGGSSVGVQWSDFTGVNGNGVAMGRYTTSGISVESGTLECDMASTTEAIYATGQMNVLLWSIFFVLVFGFLGFAFTKGYLSGKKK